MTRTPPEWPIDRGSYSAILLQFGKTRADLLGWALSAADPLADAVAEEVHALGRDARAQLQRGMASGLIALDDPSPAIAALLTETERLPAYPTMTCSIMDLPRSSPCPPPHTWCR